MTRAELAGLKKGDLVRRYRIAEKDNPPVWKVIFIVRTRIRNWSNETRISEIVLKSTRREVPLVRRFWASSLRGFELIKKG